jgi:hypothetical protein
VGGGDLIDGILAIIDSDIVRNSRENKKKFNEIKRKI